MSISATYTVSLSGVTTYYQANVSPTGTALSSISEPVATGETDFELLIAANNGAASDNVKAFALLSDRDVSVKIAEADNTVLDTIALTAGAAYIWAEGVAEPTWRNAGDIAKLRVTNASGETANIACDILHDATP